MIDRSTFRPFAFILAALALSTLTLGVACDAAASATIGEPAPGFTLTDLEGGEHSLDQYRGSVVVLEWINPRCPFSERHAREETMIRLADRDGIVWLAINSTNPEHQDFMSREAHEEYNRKHGIDYPVLYDTTGEIGQAYGAKTTPQMYVIDEEGVLLYDGAIDDDPLARSAPKERTNYVLDALDALDAGEEVDPATTKPYGCSVKY